MEIEDWLDSYGVKWEYVPAVPLKDFDVEKSLANQARFTVLDPAVVETYTEAVKRGDQFVGVCPGSTRAYTTDLRDLFATAGR